MRLESALRVADRAGGRLHPAAVDTLMRGLHAIERRVGALAAGKPVAPVAADLLEALGSLPEAGKVASALPSVATGLPAEVAGKLNDSERSQLAAAGAARRARRFRPRVGSQPGWSGHHPGARAAGTRGGDRQGGAAVPAPRRGCSGGLVFAILLVTEAPDAEVAAAAGREPRRSTRLGPPLAEPPAPVTRRGLELAPSGEIDVAETDGADDGSARRGVVRVDVARLDDALEKLSDLVVTRSRLQRTVDGLHAQGVGRAAGGAASPRR